MKKVGRVIECMTVARFNASRSMQGESSDIYAWMTKKVEHICRMRLVIHSRYSTPRMLEKETHFKTIREAADDFFFLYPCCHPATIDQRVNVGRCQIKERQKGLMGRKRSFRTIYIAVDYLFLSTSKRLFSMPYLRNY